MSDKRQGGAAFVGVSLAAESQEENTSLDTAGASGLSRRASCRSTVSAGVVAEQRGVAVQRTRCRHKSGSCERNASGGSSPNLARRASASLRYPPPPGHPHNPHAKATSQGTLDSLIPHDVNRRNIGGVWAFRLPWKEHSESEGLKEYELVLA